MAAENYTAQDEQLNPIQKYPFGMSNHYGDCMVRENDDSFIGNSTLLDVLLNEYIKQFREFSENEVKVTLTYKQRDALKEISFALEDEFCTMAFGVEAISHLLSRCNFEDDGFDADQLNHLARLLELLSKSLHNHRDLIEYLSDDLARSSVSY